jgi:hypothetical protein
MTDLVRKTKGMIQGSSGSYRPSGERQPLVPAGRSGTKKKGKLPKAPRKFRSTTNTAGSARFA